MTECRGQQSVRRRPCAPSPRHFRSRVPVFPRCHSLPPQLTQAMIRLASRPLRPKVSADDIIHPFRANVHLPGAAETADGYPRIQLIGVVASETLHTLGRCFSTHLHTVPLANYSSKHDLRLYAQSGNGTHGDR